MTNYETNRQSLVPGNRQMVRRLASLRNITMYAIGFAIQFTSAHLAHAQGVWTPLANPNPAGGCGTMQLLTDGTVMVQGAGETNVWTKLTPDAHGNYINGTWTTTAPMTVQRLYFGSNVLPSGKLLVLGGEYSNLGSITNTGEIYDPLANTWTPIANFPQPEFGDDPTMLLPSGKILCGYIFDGRTYLYDPSTNIWTQTGTKLRSDASDEETWSLLPDGSVLSYDIFASPATGAGSAQRYIPATGKWVDAGSVPVPLSGNAFGFELGPSGLLPDGRIIYIGANNNSVIYTPSTNSWAQGPSLPANMGADDAPGAMLPNGHFLFAADTSQPNVFTPPTKLYSFDYTTNAITDVTPAALSTFLNAPAFIFRMLILPNGHLLLCSGSSSTIWDFAPSGSAQASWAPTITGSPVRNSDGSYTLTGTQLTGISQGAKYGDDAEMDSNYPIVRLTSGSGAVTYARTTNWTPGVATGSLQTTVVFAVPANLAIGSYVVSVIANGIPSVGRPVDIGGIPSNVIASYSGGTLTLTGNSANDNNPHNLTVTETAGKITIQGANGTKINNQTSYSVAVSGNWNLSVTFAGGDDSIAFIGVSQLPNANIQLGAGNDKASFTLCTIGTLTINGGPGTNTFLQSSSKFTKLNETNFTK